MNAYMAQVRQLYAPSAASMLEHLTVMGKSLHCAADDLAAECTIPRIDDLVSRLKTAQTTLQRLRLAVIENEIERQGTGIRTYQQEQMK